MCYIVDFAILSVSFADCTYRLAIIFKYMFGIIFEILHINFLYHTLLINKLVGINPLLNTCSIEIISLINEAGLCCRGAG